MYYRDKSEIPKIRMDVDTDRIRDLVSNALLLIDELLVHPEYGGSREKLLSDLNIVLDSRMISVSKLVLQLGNSAMNDLSLVIDMKRRKIVAHSSRFPTKRILLNSALKGAG